MTAIQTINIGNYSNDGTGDDLRTAFQKVNANFSALSSEVTIANATNLGGVVDNGAGIFAQRTDANLEFKTLVCDDNSISFSSDTDLVTLRSKTTLLNDPSPTLNANLHLNGHNITGSGDIQSSVFGYDVSLIQSLLSVLLATNTNINVNMGTIEQPTGKTSENLSGLSLDFGTIVLPTKNTIDFGQI